MARSTLATLVEEVADLLRHDHFDTRIQTWVSVTLNDLTRRFSLWRFWLYTSGTISAGDETAELSSTASTLGDVIGCVMCEDGSSGIYTPRYVPIAEFQHRAHDLQGGSAVTGTVPLIYSIGPAPRTDATEEDIGRDSIYVAPIDDTNDRNYALWYVHPWLTDNPASTAYSVGVPYHFEGALVWGAAAMGAKAISPQLYPLFTKEYEDAIASLAHTVLYKPDGMPVLRSAKGPYGVTQKGLAPPRFPTGDISA